MKERILNIHSQVCDSTKKQIEQEFPEFFNPELEKGKWYWVESSSPNYGKALIYYQGNGRTYGWGHLGLWTNTYYDKDVYNPIPATDQEVREALIKEAKKRYGENWIEAQSNVRTIITSHIESRNLLTSNKTVLYYKGEWFEEVQEPKFKAGDYICAIKTGNVYEIEDCEIIEDELHWNVAGVSRHEYAFSTYLHNIRHATPEEIEEYNRQLPYIDGYKGKQEGNHIVYGCKRIHIQDIRRLYEACTYSGLTVDSIVIEGHQIQMETIQEIYEKLKKETE